MLYKPAVSQFSLSEARISHCSVAQIQLRFVEERFDSTYDLYSPSVKYRCVWGLLSSQKSVPTFLDLADTTLSMLLQDKETPHPSLTTHPNLHKLLTNDMYTVPRGQPPPTRHYIPPFFHPSSEISPDEKYPLLIHTQPLIPGQIYIPHLDGDGSTTRCSSSTLALCDDDTRKIFTPCGPGPDRMLTPPPVCEKREQLMTREILMMSPHTYSYAASFYPVNQSSNRNDENQQHKNLCRQPPLAPPSPLEVAPYRSLQRMWKKQFMDGSEAPDLPIMGFYARRLVHCNCIWDEDELMHLSRAFVWRAKGRGERPTDPLAAFASQVHHVFHIAPWTGTDENFRLCLWDVVRETFVSSWHFEVCLAVSLPLVGWLSKWILFIQEQKTSRKAVTYIKDPSPGYMKYVVSALSVCSFIGDLFRYDFITRPDTVGCIRVLMHNLTTVEHITAIRNIIKHAGVPLWRQALNLEEEVSEFRKVLLEKSRPLKDYRTVLPYRINGNARVKSRVNEILGHVEDCIRAVGGNDAMTGLRRTGCD